MDPKIISLEEAQKLLGNVVICLEPEKTMQEKIAKGKENELWRFNPATGISGRGDQRFFDIRIGDRGGYNQLFMYEEPLVKPVPGQDRIIGQIIIEMLDGKVVARTAKGINGEVLELKPSSISKGELIKNGVQPVAYIETNPQRADGTVEVYLVNLKEQPQLKPNETMMTPAEFAKNSRDARSLAALTVAGLI